MTSVEPSSAQSPGRRLLWSVFVLVSILSILAATLLPQSSDRGENWIPFSQSGPAMAALWRSANPLQHPSFRFLLFHVVGNVAAFVPIGFGLAGLQASRGRRSLLSAVLLGTLLSLTIEVLQLGLPTRATDVDDVLFNTMGAVLGVGLFLLARGRSPRKKRRSTQL